MNQTKIKAEIVGHSLSPQGDELISVLCTFPRIILSEMNTHRMLSKNTSSSRAIPFHKMVKAVQENPFIPIAWQKEHKGMQGSEYITDEKNLRRIKEDWLEARDNAIHSATQLNNGFNLKDEEGKYVMTRPELRVDRVTKQLCNRLLEPFMWTTMLITGSKEGWNNFFSLRCPQYIFGKNTGSPKVWKSKKDAIIDFPDWESRNSLFWNTMNYGQAEIHIMDLAEKIYDAMNESIPKKLAPNSWHIPFSNKIPFVGNLTESIDEDNTYWKDYDEQNKVKISVAMAARTSYTVVGEEKDIDYKKMIELHDRLLSQDPPHSSPLEHCARAMSDYEYDTFVKGKITDRRGVYDFQNPYDYSREESIKNRKNVGGWCNNLKGFIPYRYMIDNNLIYYKRKNWK